MAFENVFDGGKGVKCFEVPGASVRRALSKSRDVPDAHRLVHGRGHDEVIFGVEERGHDIMRMTGEDSDAVARCTVPYAYGLVVGSRDLAKKY